MVVLIQAVVHAYELDEPKRPCLFETEVIDTLLHSGREESL